MRAEYASVPWLAPIAELMPRVLAVDFTQAVIGRDWMIQSFLPGTPAPDKGRNQRRGGTCGPRLPPRSDGTSVIMIRASGLPECCALAGCAMVGP
ncbi:MULTISPECIES: hypothetical protein [Streptomyces]|uniref:hypothetical protein n=1 Tax=Streptomyces TaxID=1883 RepID=UPI0004CC53D7|nr:hypothetical protein [Streptomyces sp. NRRL S-378]